MTAGDRTRAIQSVGPVKRDRISHMLDNMPANGAYLAARAAAGGDADGALLDTYRRKFRDYRTAWTEQPRRAVAEGLTGAAFKAGGNPPLCIDIEVAAVCDLACPFCYRQHIATPDKIMDPALAFRIIDQAAELGVPSIKFNWRGEPLLNPSLPDFIRHAKKRGIVDTIINSNATELDEDMSRRLIDAGLDFVIYSFDGGTARTYEKMRPGRFKANSFEHVYGNIRRFAEIRDAMGSPFPYTKIQMILTAETFGEQESFHRHFDDCVDDVSVKQYTERGAGLDELDADTRARVEGAMTEHGLGADTAIMRSGTGDIFVSTGRLPCEQPFQRVLVTYDGKVGMCCYDWGAKHPVGYVDDASFAEPEKEYTRIVERATKGDKGFELLAKAAMPKRYNEPPKTVEALGDVWYGSEIDHVRACHVEGRGDKVDICRECPFKETYDWKKV